MDIKMGSCESVKVRASFFALTAGVTLGLKLGLFCGAMTTWLAVTWNNWILSACLGVGAVMKAWLSKEPLCT